MKKDNVYYFDKITFKRDVLGEIQTDFNMSFVIDGTKDSSTILVFSYVEFEIEPYTILWHESTNTWWVVSHDKVERFENEQGYYYLHNLDIVGAIELANARDLTDCGFNESKYTIENFIKRLFSLSTFEYDILIDTEMNLNNKVYFVKTFENYTLYSALREFLDAYNSCAKLEFVTNETDNETYIDYAVLKILLKTGNGNLESHNIDDFKYTKEIKTIDKNSYGTCVVSNASNVISTQAKTYPATGLLGFSSNSYKYKFENALLRLPTNVFKINWLKIVNPSVCICLMTQSSGYFDLENLPYDNDKYSINRIKEFIALHEPYIGQSAVAYYIENADLIWKRAKDCYTITLYNGVQYNPNNTFTKPTNVPYIPKFISSEQGGSDLELIICDKSVKTNMEKTQQGIAWERGSNLITGFEIFEHNKRTNFQYTDGYYLNGTSLLYHADSGSYIKAGRYVDSVQSVSLDSKFIVNYIPTADLKLKVDNARDKKDIKIYNQNGKLTDSYALSKLLNSYSKEISSSNITRYGHYYDFDSVPKVGSLVFKGNETYVINNVAMTFAQNDGDDNDICYFIECEFNICKYISTKSLMTNPNTNIRDYGIPQQYNVKRRQVFRDYYELDYDFYTDANQETPYLQLNKILNLGEEYKKVIDYSVFIKATYSEEIGYPLSYDWYYQLDCSAIVMQKQVVFICDFLDNNIIGYCQNNRQVVWNASTLFDVSYNKINTPISYVDDNGEIKDLELVFIRQEHRGEIDYDYYHQQGIGAPFDALATQVFIPKELYDLAINEEKYDFIVTFEDYNKDAIETPVFEYCCQVDDSDNVLVGDNVLNQYEGYFNFYSRVQGNNLTMNTVQNFNDIIVDSELYEGENYLIYTLNNAVKFEYISNNEIKVTMYRQVVYSTRTKTWQYIDQVSIPTNIDLAIFRHSLNVDVGSTIDEQDAMFIFKKIPSAKLSDNGMSLVIKANHYKLN